MVVCRVTRAAPRSAPQPVRDGSASVKSSWAAAQGPTRASLLSVSPTDLAPSAATESSARQTGGSSCPPLSSCPGCEGRPPPPLRPVPTLHDAPLCQQSGPVSGTGGGDGHGPGE